MELKEESNMDSKYEQLKRLEPKKLSDMGQCFVMGAKVWIKRNGQRLWKRRFCFLLEEGLFYSRNKDSSHMMLIADCESGFFYKKRNCSTNKHYRFASKHVLIYRPISKSLFKLADVTILCFDTARTLHEMAEAIRINQCDPLTKHGWTTIQENFRAIFRSELNEALSQRNTDSLVSKPLARTPLIERRLFDTLPLISLEESRTMLKNCGDFILHCADLNAEKMQPFLTVLTDEHEFAHAQLISYEPNKVNLLNEKALFVDLADLVAFYQSRPAAFPINNAYLRQEIVDMPPPPQILLKVSLGRRKQLHFRMMIFR
ncbi:hypothetical protein Ciccas_009465 [Cichlidogyrus casuarinus]|uniref:PH domain-containing protein n=1 Tax=Cichlidogyrus casuarinus TaxID=1844966 RepID=A0ABD2PXN7_9PLAT